MVTPSYVYSLQVFYGFSGILSYSSTLSPAQGQTIKAVEIFFCGCQLDIICLAILLIFAGPKHNSQT